MQQHFTLSCVFNPVSAFDAVIGYPQTNPGVDPA
jgi:hypothetical protein